MREITFDTPLLKISGRETKFDTSIVSNSFVALIGDFIEARIVQQLHYWSYSEYGVIINGLRWIYKPIREWLSEAFIGFTSWQLRKAIASLVEKELLLREHLFKEHHGNNFAPKNRTYYYSVNYKKLEELVKKQENAESLENLRFVRDTQQFCESSENQFCNSLQTNTKNTSKENSSKDKSHPTLPSECDNSNSISQDKDSLDTSELLSISKETKQIGNKQKAVRKENNYADVENKVNKDIGTTLDVESNVKPKLKVSKVTRQKKAPWKDEEQFKQFYRTLIQALPIVANSHSPAGLAQTIIRQLRCGIPHSYWDDFEAGQPIGTSTKPEWEITPGEPYPMFVEYLTEKIKRGDNTTSEEQTRNEVFRILNKPRQAKAFWGQFKRSVVNVARTVERDRALGVSNPNIPVWTRERVEPSIEEAAVAGEKIMAVNGSANHAIAAVRTLQLETQQSFPKLSEPDNSQSVNQSTNKGEEISDPWSDKKAELNKPSKPSLRELLTQKLGNRNLKGFVKAMPKVTKSEAKAEAVAENEAMLKQKRNQKTHLNQMSVDEINKLLADPIMRKELTRQIIFNDKFDVVTDNLGEVLAVKVSKEYRNNGGT